MCSKFQSFQREWACVWCACIGFDISLYNETQNISLVLSLTVSTCTMDIQMASEHHFERVSTRNFFIVLVKHINTVFLYFLFRKKYYNEKIFSKTIMFLNDFRVEKRAEIWLKPNCFRNCQKNILLLKIRSQPIAAHAVAIIHDNISFQVIVYENKQVAFNYMFTEVFSFQKMTNYKWTAEEKSTNYRIHWFYKWNKFLAKSYRRLFLISAHVIWLKRLLEYFDIWNWRENEIQEYAVFCWHQLSK